LSYFYFFQPPLCENKAGRLWLWLGLRRQELPMFL
jgi:hypothetical protein